MKKTAFLGLAAIMATMLVILGCGQATTGKYTGQGVITMNGKATQQPVTLEINERLYKDYNASYSLQSSHYQGSLQMKKSDGKLIGRTIFTYYKNGDKASDPVTTCDVELNGTFETVEDTLSGKLCGKDFACSNGTDICVEFKALKRSAANANSNSQNGNWWTNPPTTTLPNGGNGS